MSESPWKTIRQIVVTPLKNLKAQVFWLVILSTLVSIAQGVIIFIFGPVFKLLFSDMSQETAKLSQMIPQNLANAFSLNIEQTISYKDLYLWIPALLAIFGLVRGLALYFLNLRQERISLAVAHHCRVLAFSSIVKAPYLTSTSRSAAEWMSVVMNDIMYLQQRFTELFKSLIKDGLTVVGALIAIAAINLQMTLILIAASLPLGFIMGAIGKKISYFTERTQDKMSKLTALGADFVKRFVDIKVSKGEKRDLALFRKENEELFYNQRNSIFLRSLFAPALEFFGFFVFAVFLWAFVSNDFNLDINPEFLMQFVIALGVCLRPLRNLGEQISKFQETKGALSSSISIISESTDLKPMETIDSKNPVKMELPLHIGEMIFSYGEDHTCKAKDLSVSKSDFVVLSGLSGSGKSTFIKVLAGLLEPLEWNSKTQWSTVTNQVGFVGQSPFLFEGSVRDNLLYGLPQPHMIKDETILSHCRQLGLENIFDKPEDLDTPLSTYSQQLSGGQRQRLTIIRALLQEKPILLLDEATSALDQETESQTLEIIHKIYKRKNGAVIFITHREVRKDLITQHWNVKNGVILSEN